MLRLVVGTSLSGTVCASTGAAPTAAKAIRPVMVENLVIFTLFEKVRTLRISGYARWSSAIRHGSHLMRSEEHTSELQSLMRISSAVFCLKTKTTNLHTHYTSFPL